jgi:hypothetical protein
LLHVLLLLEPALHLLDVLLFLLLQLVHHLLLLDFNYFGFVVDLTGIGLVI